MVITGCTKAEKTILFAHSQTWVSVQSPRADTEAQQPNTLRQEKILVVTADDDVHMCKAEFAIQDTDRQLWEKFSESGENQKLATMMLHPTIHILTTICATDILVSQIKYDKKP